jgi:hypothetical protein
MPNSRYVFEKKGFIELRDSKDQLRKKVMPISMKMGCQTTRKLFFSQSIKGLNENYRLNTIKVSLLGKMKLLAL